MLTTRPREPAATVDGDRIPIRRALVGLGLRGVGAGLTLLQSALLARTAGAGGLGLYFVSSAWSRVGGAGAALGLPPYVLRRSAALHQRGRVADADRLVRRSRRLVTVVGVGMAGSVLVVLSALYGARSIGWTTYAVAASAAVGAAAVASTRLLADALKGRNDPELALVVEFSLPSLAFSAVLAAVLARGAQLSVGWMLGAAVAAIAAVPLAGWLWWDRRSPSFERVPPRSEPAPVEEPRPAFARRDLAHLTALSGLNIVLWAQPTLIMPFFLDEADVGRFGVAQRVVAVASLNIVALGSHFMPRFAAAEAVSDRGRLHREAGRATGLALASYLPFFAVFVLWPGSVLRLFGGELDGVAAVLVIMALGQLVNAATGLCSEVLIMTGHERLEVRSTAAAVAVMFVATVVGGTTFGIMGVAVAFAGSMALRNVVSYTLMRRTLREATLVGAAA